MCNCFSSHHKSFLIELIHVVNFIFFKHLSNLVFNYKCIFKVFCRISLVPRLFIKCLKYSYYKKSENTFTVFFQWRSSSSCSIFIFSWFASSTYLFGIMNLFLSVIYVTLHIIYLYSLLYTNRHPYKLT